MSYPPYLARDGKTYPTTKFHWYAPHEDAALRLLLCPVCDCRPCELDCPEQLEPAPPGSPMARSTPSTSSMPAGEVRRGAR